MSQATVTDLEVGRACNDDKLVVEPQEHFIGPVETLCYSVGFRSDDSFNWRLVVRAIKTKSWNNQIVFDRSGTIDADTKRFNFDLTRRAGWPNGTYRIEAYHDDKIVKTLDYTIEEEAKKVE